MIFTDKRFSQKFERIKARTIADFVELREDSREKGL